MQGAVDLAFEDDGKMVIVDYKTDRVRDINKLVTLYKNSWSCIRKHSDKRLKQRFPSA